ncbi:hypothetical protein FM106_22400 [Brachybacterium faecium]|nr:hypothetical protein FM106_22400 [Brachybacterium faecium]
MPADFFEIERGIGCCSWIKHYFDVFCQDSVFLLRKLTLNDVNRTMDQLNG